MEPARKIRVSTSSGGDKLPPQRYTPRPCDVISGTTLRGARLTWMVLAGFSFSHSDSYCDHDCVSFSPDEAGCIRCDGVPEHSRPQWTQRRWPVSPTTIA